MIQVIHRALDIIELILNSKDKSMPLRDIADELHLNHSTCANILKTLTSRKYLVKSTVNKNYKIGPMLISAMSDDSHSYKLISAAEGPMRDLSKLTNENCALGILKDNIRLVIHEVLAEQELNVIGKREKPVYETSTGRVILAYLSRKEQTRFIKQYGLPKSDVWPEARDEASLLNELDAIRNIKFATQVSASHVVGLAVPIESGNGFVASLGVFLPEVRFSEPKKSIIIKELFAAQQKTLENLQ